MPTTITLPVAPSGEPGDHSYHVPKTGETGWHEITNVHEFVKWQYSDSPYRVVADLDESRGHWRALFTTWYGGQSYTIRGNCGGGPAGRMKALAAAKNWMEKHSNGCPPPGEM